jgi:hypothetical protein
VESLRAPLMILWVWLINHFAALLAMVWSNNMAEKTGQSFTALPFV